MSKKDLVNELSARTGSTKAETIRFIDELASLALVKIRAGEEFVIPGVVKMVKAERAARDGRNPYTGDKIKIPARAVTKAKPLHPLNRF